MGITQHRNAVPTVREIGAHFGIGSPNGVMCHLKALDRKRRLTLTGTGRARIGIVLPRGGPVVALEGDVQTLRIPGRLKCRLTAEEALALAESLKATMGPRKPKEAAP